MNTSRPPKRYLNGFVIAQMDSQEDFGDSPKDKLIKRLSVQAVENDIGEYELVACIEVEIISIDANDKDHGVFETPVEVYRMPFFYDPTVRKIIVRTIRVHEKYFKA